MSKDKTPDDSLLWYHYVRDIKPLSDDKKLPELPVVKSTLPKKPSLQCFGKAQKPDLSPQFFQRREWRQVHIDAEFDMHGMTLQRGFHALIDFLRSAQVRHLKTVLVITGKGSLKKEDTLRHQLPRWLEEEPLKSLVAAYRHPAKSCHGGSGAFYVRLRRSV